jgi:hypothetical protein
MIAGNLYSQRIAWNSLDHSRTVVNSHFPAFLQDKRASVVGPPGRGVVSSWPLRHLAARSLTLAFGAKRTFGGRTQRIYEFAAREATFEPNLNVAYSRLGRCAAYTVEPGAIPNRLGKHSVCSGPGRFHPTLGGQNSCEKIAAFAPRREGGSSGPPNQRLPNGTGEASGWASKCPIFGAFGGWETDLPAGSGCSNDSRQP